MIHCKFIENFKLEIVNFSKEEVIQFQVPQNIDMEDKIIGPLTLIQFLYLLAGGVVDYLIFLSIGPSFVFWVIGLPIALISLALAFLKIQDQPLSYFVRAGLTYLSRPKIRLWQRQGLAPTVIFAAKKKTVIAPPPPKKRIEKSELEKLAYSLDTHSIPK